jgi:hypothetical protein
MEKQISYDEMMRKLVANSNDIPEDLDEVLPEKTESEIKQIAKTYKKSEGEVRETFNEEYEKIRKNYSLSDKEENEMYARMHEEEEEREE